MKWLQQLRTEVSQHKYAINAKLLGDSSELAWSNLGYWSEINQTYPEACRALADHLAHSVQLTASDHLLDLGCGQGASLLHWQQQYQVQHIEAVELQPKCVQQIQTAIPKLKAIHCHSFLNLKNISFQQAFDVVLCIDAAYHSSLNSFLNSVTCVLNLKGRLGFHSLILSPEFLNLNAVEKMQLALLLKAADVNLKDLLDEVAVQQQLAQAGFEHIQIEDFSEPVLGGFARYIRQQTTAPQTDEQSTAFDVMKIKLTAKLCQKLWTQGVVRYVQVTAQKK
ncbi:SAM-dependent methyltransferase [Acinetobacter sp. ANC 4178]|uniref:SAM-dependent methyltransferase n=1 Tax=Acinetobacter sp. ANC 4178 TaxID=2529839 RepID=UPI0010398A80|nr:class I SAM-dependent methyltransferase [Acinetobacter sp. ANC 4178]TCB65527.1 methyltransferase domain-containing protein [Acinetobacter sp. ANC 4178]